MALGKTVSPIDFGLQNANTGEERFWVLYNTHEMAKKRNWKVSYKGISKIEIDIPSDAISIPLGNKTDFCNVIIVTNNSNKDNYFLFELSQKHTSVSVPKEVLATYNFRSVPELKRGRKLLIIEDQNVWIDNRIGYNYSIKRKDVLLLNRGHSVNRTIASYDNDFSKPSFYYVDVNKSKKEIKNITLSRTKSSTCKTFLLQVMNMDNVRIEGVQIITPKSSTLVGDLAISVQNSTNVNFKDITIDQTYSLKNSAGYGILIENVYNTSFETVKAETNWGVFGANYVNTISMSNSSVNRFDAHC